MKKIIFGSDHNGINLKHALIEYSVSFGHETYDIVLSPGEDYIDITSKVVSEMGVDQDAIAVLICGSGFGMCMAANKYPTIRAALCRNKEDSERCRRQNDANILCFGSELTNLKTAKECLHHFIFRPFKIESHERTVKKLCAMDHLRK